MATTPLDRRKLLPYAACLGLILGTTLLGELIKESLEPTNIVMFYLLIVVVAAVRWGRVPAVMTSILGVAAFDFFLIPPYFSLTVASIHYIFTFIGFLVVGLVTSTLASRMKEQAIQAERREAQTAAMYRLSSDLANVDTHEGALEAIRRNVGEVLEGDVAVFLPVAGAVQPVSLDAGFPLTENEISSAQRVFETGQPSPRRGEETPSTRTLFMPFNTPDGILGVLGLRFHRATEALTRDEENVLNALVSQAAVAIQRAKLSEEARQVELMKQTEKLQSALLSSVSHDLKTPLASITGALTTLLDRESELDASARTELLESAREDSDRLNRLVGNLLDMTRMEAQALRISKTPCELADVIGASLEQLKEKIGARIIQVTVSKDLPEMLLDVPYMIKVFTNLIDNALKYSPADSPITVSARVTGDTAEIEITDRGMGIPAADLKRVFDKFYRTQQPHRAAGIGLGLSICKGIIEAHGGEISARNNPDVGATFTLTLPLR